MKLPGVSKPARNMNGNERPKRSWVELSKGKLRSQLFSDPRRWIRQLLPLGADENAELQDPGGREGTHEKAGWGDPSPRW